MPDTTGTLGGALVQNQQLPNTANPGMAQPGVLGGTPGAGMLNLGNNNYTYNLGQQNPIQGSVMNNASQFNTGYIDPSKSPVSSVQGGNYYDQASADAVYNQAKSRLDPQWEEQKNAMAAQLANQGVTAGSEAWNAQMAQFNRGRNDAYTSAQNAAVQQAAADAARMQGMDISAGTFANQAAQQDYTNKLTSQQAQNAALTGQQALDVNAGNFANTAQQQGFQQNLANAQLGNEAVKTQQGFQSAQNMAQMQKDAAASQAQGAIQAAMMQGASQREIAQMQASLQQRQIENQERQQDYTMGKDMYMMPLEIQNMMMQGMMPPTSMPNFTGFNQAPGAPNLSDYYAQAAKGGNQAAGGFGGSLMSLAGMLF